MYLGCYVSESIAATQTRRPMTLARARSRRNTWSVKEHIATTRARVYADAQLTSSVLPSAAAVSIAAMTSLIDSSIKSARTPRRRRKFASRAKYRRYILSIATQSPAAIDARISCSPSSMGASLCAGGADAGGSRTSLIGGGRRSGHQTAKNQVDVSIQECFVDRRARRKQAIVDRAV
jgi:hypothetical protein